SGGGEGSGAYRIGERPARDAGGPGGSAGGRPGAPGAARIETHVESMPAASTGASDYGGDLLQQVDRYARFCLAAARHLQFDIIHAHDWMTYPAGMLVARVTGKPLVTHIHSTEFDRSGEGANRFIADVERRGMHAAMRVIAVSQLTKNIVCRRYALRPGKVEVVYNGVDTEPSRVGMTGIRRKDKIVLYFGRITYQKG
ncbi:MAG: glycosyltransferase family 4 protein, partial [Phycisphaerales bacterium]|nr:glycosyltransferase family 4 protein [Phycisphaerales bacterium]